MSIYDVLKKLANDIRDLARRSGALRAQLEQLAQRIDNELLPSSPHSGQAGEPE